MPVVTTVAAPLLEDVRLITVVWIGRLGDFVISTPVLAALRRRFPGAKIRMVVGEKGVEAAQLCPDVDDILVLRNALRPWAVISLIIKLFKGRSDLLIDLNSARSRSAMIVSLLARARVKLSFDKRGGWVYRYRVAAPDEKEHMLDRYGRLAAALQAPYEPRPKLKPRPSHAAEAQKILGEAFVRFNPLIQEAKQRWLAIHPGNFQKFDNRWPEHKFVELTNRLLQVDGLKVFYLCGPGEQDEVRAIVDQLDQPVPVIPPAPLGVTAAILALTDLLIVNATGTAHLAAAVGTPTFSCLSRYTQTVWMPRTGPHFAVVSESWDSCRDVSVDLAYEGVMNALKNSGYRPTRD